MSIPRKHLLELYPGGPVDYLPAFEGLPLTPEQKLRADHVALAEEAAAWCLATGQPYTVWLTLSSDWRQAFVRVYNAAHRK